jgi:hypothetical protein
MAVTTEKSVQLGNADLLPDVKNQTNVSRGKKRVEYFSFTQGAAAGDANSLADLVKLPAGRVRVLLTECYVAGSAFGASRTLDIGYTAYRDFSGETVAADVDALLDGRDVAAATGAVIAVAAGADPTLYLESAEGVLIQAKCLGGTLPAGATLKGYVTYVTD